MAAPKGNKYAIGNNGGRPPVYDSPDKLHEKIIEYFDSLIPESTEGESKEQAIVQFPTVTGLALYLGFADKSSLYYYRDKKEKEFSYPIKRALLVIENHYETGLNYKGATGAIFALKNMKWTDKSELDVTSKGESINKTKGELEQELEEIRKRRGK